MNNNGNLTTMDVAEQAHNNAAYIREVQRDSNVLAFPKRWHLRCPNCDHEVHAQTEGGMDRGFARHYISKHRPPRITTNGTIAADLRASLDLATGKDIA